MAPLLAGLAKAGLGLLAGAIQAKGKDFIETKLGVKIPNNPEGLTPAVVGALRQAELDHEEFLVNAALKLEEMHFADTANARAMQQTALLQADVFAKRFIYYFAIGWSLAASAYIAAITFTEIPKENVRFADTILGFILGTVVATLLQFFYGSSSSSKGKDRGMAELVDSMKVMVKK